MEEDKISQLSDDILLLILDKIDIYEAVKTMILSHRWKNVWRSLTGLRFHFRLTTTPLDVDLEDFSIHSSFVSHFLSHRDPAAPVHDFHLSFDGPSPEPQCPCGVDREFLEECVLYAINHGVQSLRLHWPTKDTLRLPAAFLTCETLRELELRDLFCSVELPGRLSLPNLKTILLHTIDFADLHHSEDPFSSLPQLEKLTLINFGFDIIRAPKLRLLQIEDYGYYLTVHEISAPLLTSFTCTSHIVWVCARVNLPMLEQVYFDINEDGYRFNIIRGRDDDIVTMLHRFGNATTVSLSVDTLEILECDFGYFKQTPFPNMKCLKVMEGGSTNRRVFQGVINYLTRTLNCEVEFSPSLFISETETPHDNVVQLGW